MILMYALLLSFFHPYPTPLLNCVKKIEEPLAPSNLPPIDCIYVINLDEKREKWERTLALFSQYGLGANRFSAINGWKLPRELFATLCGPYPSTLYPGVIGCFLSHLSIYKDALERDFETVWICEDDIKMVQPPQLIPQLLEELNEIDPYWDLFYTDRLTTGMGIQYPRPNQPLYIPQYKLISPQIAQIHGRYGSHSIVISRRGLIKLNHYFSHVYLWSPIDVDIHYIPGLREYQSLEDVVTALFDGLSDTLNEVL